MLCDLNVGIGIIEHMNAGMVTSEQTIADVNKTH